MSFALLLKQGVGKKSKPGKLENFGCQFTAKFVLESSTVRPYGRLTGQLSIESPAPIAHYGIRIQYEAICTLKFESRLDNRISHHKKCGNILEGGGNTKESGEGYMESPIMIDLEPVTAIDQNDNRPYELQPGTNTYGFNLSTDADNLPAPFKNTFGTLFYKLNAYMKSTDGTMVLIASKNLRFAGYYNLSQNNDVFKPATIERYVKRSMFTSKKLVIVTLNLATIGFLPEEQLPFTMKVHNPKCLPFKVHVLLLQKATYNVGSTKKTTVAVVGNTDEDVSEPDAEMVWEGSFKVNKGTSPTYIGRSPMYSVSHTVQLKVKLDDYNVLKADQKVFIGTTRESVEALIANVNTPVVSQNQNLEDNDGLRERRGSTSSTQSSCSVSTSVSRPPAYSQLSSRMSSIETLPPGYEDVVWRDEGQGTIMENDSDTEEPSTSTQQV